MQNITSLISVATHVSTPVESQVTAHHPWNAHMCMYMYHIKANGCNYMYMHMYMYMYMYHMHTTAGHLVPSFENKCTYSDPLKNKHIRMSNKKH